MGRCRSPTAVIPYSYPTSAAESRRTPSVAPIYHCLQTATISACSPCSRRRRYLPVHPYTTTSLLLPAASCFPLLASCCFPPPSTACSPHCCRPPLLQPPLLSPTPTSSFVVAPTAPCFLLCHSCRRPHLLPATPPNSALLCHSVVVAASHCNAQPSSVTVLPRAVALPLLPPTATHNPPTQPLPSIASRYQQQPIPTEISEPPSSPLSRQFLLLVPSNASAIFLPCSSIFAQQHWSLNAMLLSHSTVAHSLDSSDPSLPQEPTSFAATLNTTLLMRWLWMIRYMQDSKLSKPE
ncbi:hypothetical protein BHE74_00058241 [Ensete ventricosum]|nr:hypothetical protein BHE74_00058241 [Ensete ventricosum]